MTRRFEARIASVRRLLAIAGEIHADRARLAPDLARHTGLSTEGVELGFRSLERAATDDELRSFVRAAGESRHVHVILSSNVFVAPLRAIALAWAAAPVVTIKPSRRDPVLARELVERIGDPALRLAEDLDARAVDADEVHIYGRAESIASVRAAAPPGVRVLGHGPGMGIAIVSSDASLERAAEQLALDIAAFDQRGCLSPRAAFVRGDRKRADAFSDALHAALSAMEKRVPSGALTADESAETRRWHDLASFSGRVLEGDRHLVATLPALPSAAIPPAGRHIAVIPSPREPGIAPLAPFIVAVGTDDPACVVPLHARRLPLGGMQMPPLDGPVDWRNATR